ncbi:uncharacterized protein LOC133921502 isoform X2 [Phragmites australis]|uniref:uncharacterized protein LOC133921502 isoform X2 n=1 Tax=Phragmites australis TaxID=29695 RepID=UPI002D76BAAB|nr:uncharacterized protein LOC133921502 isoform X2 [Phragmites australis]
MGQTVKFGRAPSQIGVSRARPKEAWQQKLNEQRNLQLYSEIQKISDCSEPEEPEDHQQAIQLLSRSICSSEIFHLLSANSVNACFGNGTLDKGKDGEGNNTLNLNAHGEIKQRVDEVTALLFSGNVHRTRHQKYKTRHTSSISLGAMAEWLKTKLVNIVQRGCGTKREDRRLQTVQMHAALSVARLATAVAGIIGNYPFESTHLSGIATTDTGKDADKKMHAAITSAASLVAASCAEAAKSAGATREQVSSVINMGLESRAMGDLLTLTTSAAACLRGVQGFKMRTISNYALEDHMNSQKGAILPVRTPEGRLHTRMVSVHCKHDNIILTLGKRRSFTTSEKYVIFDEQGERKDSSYSTDGHSNNTINLSTSGGTVQLLFEEHEQYSSWRSFINNLIMSKRAKQSYRVTT